MCTIYTFSSAFFKSNEKQAVARIRSDSLNNPHGFALELISEANPMFLQGFNVESAISLMKSQSWDRCVLHQRFSTTNFLELADCHGYVSVDGSRWYHNGIIPNDGLFRVDSINLTLCVDVKDSLELYCGSYANIIRVLDDGSVEVGRASASGSLYMDKTHNNFSTIAFGSINIPVPPLTVYKIKSRRKKKEKYVKETKGYWGADWDKFDEIKSSELLAGWGSCG